MTAAVQKWRGWLPLLLILVLAASLRLTGLEQQSFWNDELSTRVRADLPTLGELLDDGVRQDGHPQPGQYYCPGYGTHPTGGHPRWVAVTRAAAS